MFTGLSAGLLSTGLRCGLRRGPSARRHAVLSARAYTSIPLCQPSFHATPPRATTVLCGAGSLDGPSPSPSPTAPGRSGEVPPARAARTADAQACRRLSCDGRASSPAPALSTHMPRVVRVPRLLFFGGDIVSVTALEALYERLTAIATFALVAKAEETRWRATFNGLREQGDGKPEEMSELDKARISRFVADHLTVICPALPKGITPEEAAAKYTRQYPVARFCVEHDLPVVAVDHPRSLVKSQLLQDMLAHKGGRERVSASLTADGAGDGGDPASAATWPARGRALADFDLAVVVSFRYFLPRRLLRALPPVINLHPSLLPLYRGASPIFSTLLHNELRGGVSVIQMKEDQQGMDSGAVLWQCPVPIELDTDIRTYFPLVTQIGAAGLCDLIFGERTVDDLLRAAASKDPSLSTVVNAMSAANDPSTTTFTPPSAAAAGTTHTPSERLLEVVGNNRREGRLRVVPSSPLRPHFRSEWCTLCRAPPQITQSAVQAAADSHKESFHHNLLLSEQQRDERLGQRPVSAATAVGGSARTVSGKKAKRMAAAEAAFTASPGCAPAFSRSTGGGAGSTAASGPSIYAKYALTEAVTTSMKCADVFPASVLNPTCDWPDSFTYSWKFAQVQEYATFTRFTDDPHHAPLLAKDAAVLRFSQQSDLEVFGVWRAFVGGQYFQPAVNAVLDKGCTPVRNQLVRRGVRRLLRKKRGARAKSGQAPQTTQRRGAAQCDASCEPAAGGQAGSASTGGGTHDTRPHTPVHCGATSRRNTPFASKSTLPCDLCRAEVDEEMLHTAEAELRLTCTFTKAIHPKLISDALRAELDAVEAGEQGRFYRAPPPLLASVRRRRHAQHATVSDEEEESALAATASADISPAQHAIMLVKHRRREAAVARDGQRGTALPTHTATDAASVADGLLGDDDDDATDDVSAEAPQDFLPDVIHAPPPPAEPVSPRRRVHIPPGTAYFPVSCEDIGAVKCREGWLLWKEAHLRSSAQAQPVALLRKGLAMKTGLLYPGMFSEYLR